MIFWWGSDYAKYALSWEIFAFLGFWPKLENIHSKAMNKQAGKSFEQARQTHQHPRKLSTRTRFGLARESIDEIKKMSHSREER